MPTKPDTDVTGTTGDTVMDLDGLEVHYELGGNTLARLFGIGTRTVKAVDGVSVGLRKGEVLGVVGESGSGKTTLGRALLGLAPTTGGSITYHGGRGARRVSSMRGKELRELRTDIQMVFQDPHAALNPSMDIETAIGHPLRIHGIAKGDELRRRVVDVLANKQPKGGIVETTLDPLAQQAASTGLERLGATTRGAVVALRPSTGEILATRVGLSTP